MSTIRLVTVLGLVFMFGACVSVDKHVIDSTPHQPATVELMDTTNDTVFWKMDIPVWCRLKVDFDRAPEYELFKVNETFPRTKMTWTIHQKDDNTVIKKGVENLCGLPFLMRISYRNPPEMPEVLPGNCLQLGANADLAAIPSLEDYDIGALAASDQVSADPNLQQAAQPQQLQQQAYQPQAYQPQPTQSIPATPVFSNTQTTTLGSPVAQQVYQAQPQAQQQALPQWQAVDQSAYRPYQPAQAQPTFQAAAQRQVTPAAPIAAARPVRSAVRYQPPKQQVARLPKAPAGQWTAVPAAPVADFPAKARRPRPRPHGFR